MNVKPLQLILHTNHLPLTVLALSQVGSIAYGSFPSQSKNKVFEDYPKPTSRQDFKFQCLGWASLDAPTPNKLLGLRGVLTRPPNPAGQGRAIGSNPATFLVDHPVVTG
ncbi:unnamed protein product [Vicia faba]|uniref:Uncharacterized protein n=1 Tax=Vicia faba TaxID=3906 RepID=A0AAV1A3P5_VICFA|nr:unnamed protein product [Vicia faba]